MTSAALVEHWTETAACRSSVMPDLFFPSPSDISGTEAAKTVCRRCPVIRECLRYSLTFAVEGVWGGTTPSERDRLRRRHRLTAHPIVDRALAAVDQHESETTP